MVMLMSYMVEMVVFMSAIAEMVALLWEVDKNSDTCKVLEYKPSFTLFNIFTVHPNRVLQP